MKSATPQHTAHAIASKLLVDLKPHVDRIEVAGSLRRGRLVVGDVELVAIPKFAAADLFGGETINLLWSRLSELVEAGEMFQLQGGPLARRYAIPLDAAAGTQVQVDVYTANAATWGVALALRTGPREYSKRLVTERSRGGLLPDGCMVRHNRLWQRATRPQQGETPPADFLDCELGFFLAIPTPEEKDFLAHAGGWVEPSRRYH